MSAATITEELLAATRELVRSGELAKRRQAEFIAAVAIPVLADDQIAWAAARGALTEGAWAYRMRPRIGRHKVDRIDALPKAIRDIG
jgi:hypothetical protein